METFRERCSLKTCPAGQYLKQVFSQEDCYFCPQGKFIPRPSRNLKCSECPKGKYNAHLARENCRMCAAGQVSASRGSAKCSKCKTGKTSDASSTMCVAQLTQQSSPPRATGAGADHQGHKGTSHAAQPKEFCSCVPGVSPRSLRTRCAASHHTAEGDSSARRLVANDAIVRVEHTQLVTRRLVYADAVHAHHGGEMLSLTHVCKVVEGRCHCCDCNNRPQESSADEAAAWMAAFHAHERDKA